MAIFFFPTSPPLPPLPFVLESSVWHAIFCFFLVLNILGEPGAHECKDARERKTRSKDSLFCTYLFSAPHPLPLFDAAAEAERPSSLSQRQLFRICVRHEKNRSEERSCGGNQSVPLATCDEEMHQPSPPPSSPLFNKCLNYRISRLQILRKRGEGGEKTSRQIRINLGLTRSKHTHHIHTHACRNFSKQIPPPLEPSCC